jgi:uncharacterized tellurite resistance protein B-like protein
MMIDAIKHFFTEKTPSDPKDQISTDRRVAIAVCALLLEMAHADDQFNKEEEENILSILKQKHHLSDEDAHKLLELAELEREESLDLWQFTNLINQNYSKFEKRGVIETLWQVIYADGKADKHEEYLMHKLIYLLNIPHEEMITAKLQARERRDRHVSDDNP